LAGGVAVIRVAAATETEMKEKIARAEDALKLARATVDDGVVPGGGIALLRASRTLSALAGNAQPGAAIVMRACEEPFREMAATAGLEEEDAVMTAVGNANTCYGLNVVTGEWQDLVAAGIVDSAKVTCLALEVAATEAVSFLTSETAAFEA
jgi:chaperonin GroEL